MDAYNYYKFGAIKGIISYISPSDIEKKFYCIAKLNNYNKSINLKAGYQFKGEVIIEEMRLYQYIIKKLFNKFANRRIFLPFQQNVLSKPNLLFRFNQKTEHFYYILHNYS